LNDKLDRRDNGAINTGMIDDAWYTRTSY